MQSDKRLVALIGGTGFGKCLDSDEELTLADGSRATVRDLVGRRFELISSDESGAFSPAPAMAEWAEHEPVYELVTDSGRRIVRNAKHPLWAATAGRLNGRTPQLEVRGWTPIHRLVEFDLVAVARSLPVAACGVMPADEIKVIAYLIGDGGLTKATPTFTQTDGPQLDEFRSCAEALGCWLVPQPPDPITYRVVGKSRGGLTTKSGVQDLLERHDLALKHSRDKRVPRAVFGLRDDLLAIFLSRLYGTDGWARARKDGRTAEIGFCSASEGLVRDIQELLLRFGVCSRIYPRRGAWTLAIHTAPDVVAFADRVGIYGKEPAVEAAKALAASKLPRTRNWRHLELPAELRWERVKSIRELGVKPTVAISVPGRHNYLSSLWEHNTWMGPHWIFSRIVKRPGTRWMCIGMQYERHVINVMQKALLDFFEAIGLVKDRDYKLVTGKRITLPIYQNAEILFGSAEKPESLEGPHLTGGIWMDEAGYMSRFAYEVAMRRTGFHAANGAQLYISTIPYVPAWLKSEVYEPWTKGDPTIEWIHCRTIDNPKYPISEIARAKRSMRPDRFATIYLGEFQRPHGAIYPIPDDDELLFDWEDEFPNGIPEDWPCYSGHDWGYNAPTTGVWGRLDPKSDILYLVAEYEKNLSTLEDHLGEWRSLGLDAVDLAFGDPANPEQWENAYRRGYPVIRGENAVLYGIDCVYDRLATNAYDRKGRPSPRLRVARGLKTLLDYRARYVWDSDPKDDNVLLDKPKKPQAAEHLMDALRYLCAGIVEEGAAPGPTEALTNRWSPS